MKRFYRGFIFAGLLSLFGLWAVSSVYRLSSVSLEDKNNKNFLYLNRNLSSIKYLIEPKCDESAKLTVLITSKSSDIAYRKAQRSVIPSTTGLQQVIFLLALDSSISNRSLLEESREHGDILLGDFYEEYHRLSYKHGMGLMWAAEYCGFNGETEKYLLKMDDDIMVRMDRVLKELPYLFQDPSDHNALAGYVQSNLKPARETDSKWFSQYPDSVYPDFLSGWTYIATQGAVRSLASSLAKERHNVFWIDDVWITGIIANQHLGLKLKSLNRFFAEYKDYIDQCCFIDMSLECMYWIGPSEGSIKTMERFGRQCLTETKCSEESIFEKEPLRLKSCSKGACLREGSPGGDNKMSCLSKYANPFRLPHSKGVGEVIPL